MLSTNLLLVVIELAYDLSSEILMFRNLSHVEELYYNKQYFI